MSKYIPKENIFDGEYFDLAIYRDRYSGYSDNLTSYEYDMVFKTNKKHNVINPPTTKQELLALADFIYDTIGEEMKDKPNWQKGDIIALINHNNCATHIFEAEYDPKYYSTYWSSVEDWYYGLRHCKEIRLATIEDIDHKIQYQKENVEREQSRLDELLNFREILENK